MRRCAARAIHQSVLAAALLVGCATTTPRAGDAALDSATSVRVRGQVLEDAPLGAEPLGNARVELVSEGKVVATAVTNGAGNFSFHDPLARGWYELVLDSRQHEARSAFDVGSSTIDVVLTARRRP